MGGGKAALAEVLRLPVDEKGSEYVNGLITGPPKLERVEVRPRDPGFAFQALVVELDLPEIGVVVLDRRKCSVLADNRMSYILSTATKVFLVGSDGAGVELRSSV